MPRRITNIVFLSVLLVNGNFISVQAQVFAGDTGWVSDDGMVNYFNLEVSGINSSIDSSFGLTAVCIDITHTWDDDLVIWLKSPDNTLVELTSHNGGGDDNYHQTCFNMSADSLITQAWAPFTGTFVPEGNLGDFNNGQDPNGTWQLVIVDEYPYADQGHVLSWLISFGMNAPAPTTPFDSTNLPLITINTNGQLITDPVRISASMKIINNGSGIYNHASDIPQLATPISIEKRGSSSIGFPQCSYGFETEDSAGNNFNVSLLGMPEENDWILYGPYDDKSLMRNALIYHLSNEIGRYASRTAYCEVLINNSYQGIYLLEEKIKQNENRVDIAKLDTDDISGDAVTGGYIMKVDKFDGEVIGYFTSQYKPCDDSSVTETIFQYHDPSPDKIKPEQMQYIQSYVDSFEDALHGNDFTDPDIGFRKYADEFSFIDHSLLNELARNVDAYRWSAFFFKDKNSNGGKINAGPIWDFNISFGNADYYDGWLHTGWQWDFPCPLPDGLNPFWWKRLLEDESYYSDLKCRWQELRGSVIDTTHIFAFIDSIASLVDEAKERHFTKYKILGVYTWPNAYYPPTYAEEIDTLKSWIAARIAWMDEELVTQCATSVSSMPSNNKNDLSVFPDPVRSNENVTITISNPESQFILVTLIDMEGRTVKKFFEGVSPKELSLSTSFPDMTSGCYFISMKANHQCITKKLLVF